MWRIGLALGTALLLLAACSGPQGQGGVRPQLAVVPQVSVEKTAVPSFKRTYRWTILKEVVDPASGSLTLSTGQTYTLKYRVTVKATAQDSDFKVTGQVVIRNTGVGDVVLQAPKDTLSTGESVALNCGVSFPYTLPQGGSLVCTYAQNLPDGQSRTNTVQVPWGTDGVSFPNTATAQAGFSFTAPTEVVDGTVDLEDSLVGSLGSATASGASYSQAFNYSYNVRFDRCGEFQVQNTARFTTRNTKATGSASATVQVRVPCLGGCTLTPGYWKTHSKYGPAPYDDTWAQIGEDTPFYLSGQSYYQVLWTPPKGNAYYILAFQFIAAQLNLLNGASTTPEVDAAMNWAKTFFSTYTPTNVPSDQAAQAKAYAATLDAYNNGLIGPGHCSE